MRRREPTGVLKVAAMNLVWPLIPEPSDQDYNEALAAAMRELLALEGGTRLFCYRRNGDLCPLTANRLNDYIATYMGEEFTAKDFRTWNATVLAAVALAGHDPPPETKTARRRAVNEAVGRVAEYLANTPAVCRSAYIDPRVIIRYQEGRTIASALGDLGKDSDFGDLATRGRAERAVLNLLAGPA